MSATGPWLAGVPIESSSTLFFIGEDEGSLRCELSRRDWNGRVITLAPPMFSGLDEAVRALEPDSENPVLALQPGVTLEHREAVKDAARRIGRAWFGARANQEARRRNGAIYRTNTLRNAAAIASEADAGILTGAFAGLPALVIGAGPSLDRNIPDIRAYRDRVVIIAADTALRPLLAAGIEPHLVVEADPSETNARHLCDLPPCPNTALVAEGSVDPESLRGFAGRTFFYRVAANDPWPWLNEHGLDCARLKSWGSVLTTAFDLARVAGCSPIVFAGADLAFTDGRPYARGTTYEENWQQAAAWGQTLESSWAASIGSWTEAYEPGVGGSTVRTAPHLRSFRDWIASEAAKQEGGSVINASGGGILIGDGLTQARLGEVLASFRTVPEDLRECIGDAHRRGRRRGALGAAVAGIAQAESGVRPAPLAAPAIQAGSPTQPVPQGPELILESGDLLAQITLAWDGLGTADRLNLIDRTGVPGGSAVRRALFTFLEPRPGLSARHGRLFDPTDNRSWIDRRPVALLNPGDDRTKWQEEHADVANRLVPVIADTLRPRSVLDVGSGAGHWLRALAAHGITDIAGVDTNFAGDASIRRYDVTLCLGVAHAVPMDTATAAIALCTKASDTVVFSVPAPAIGAPGFINERPWPVWHRLFMEHGFAPHDELRPLIESRWHRYATPFDLATVYRRIAPAGSVVPPLIANALLDAAARSDEQALDRHWYVRALDASLVSSPRPSVAYRELPIASSRMEASPTAGMRVFRYRTVAAGLAAAMAGIEPVQLRENGSPLASTIDRGVITFRATDDSDPRHNGRTYTLRVPSHVAWLEQQPLGTILEHAL